MKIKRLIIASLAILNGVLLAALLASASSLPRALAQSGQGGRDDFVSITAKSGNQSFDILYVLDSKERKLHAFYPKNVQTAELAYGQFRDLKADFGRE